MRPRNEHDVHGNSVKCLILCFLNYTTDVLKKSPVRKAALLHVIIIPLSQLASSGRLSLIQVSGRSPVKNRTEINANVSFAALVSMHYTKTVSTKSTIERSAHREILLFGFYTCAESCINRHKNI